MTTIEPLTTQQVQELSPGIRDLVVDLRAAGFRTTDSGDGSNFAEGIAGVRPVGVC